MDLDSPCTPTPSGTIVSVPQRTSIPAPPPVRSPSPPQSTVPSSATTETTSNSSKLALVSPTDRPAARQYRAQHPLFQNLAEHGITTYGRVPEDRSITVDNQSQLRTWDDYEDPDGFVEGSTNGHYLQERRQLKDCAQKLQFADYGTDADFRKTSDIITGIHEQRNTWASKEAVLQKSKCNISSWLYETDRDYLWPAELAMQKAIKDAEEKEREELERIDGETRSSILSETEPVNCRKLWDIVADHFDVALKRRPVSNASTADVPKKKPKKQHKKFTAPANDQINCVRPGSSNEVYSESAPPSSPRPARRRLVIHPPRPPLPSSKAEAHPHYVCVQCMNYFDPIIANVRCKACQQKTFCSLKCRDQWSHDFCSEACLENDHRKAMGEIDCGEDEDKDEEIEDASPPSSVAMSRSSSPVGRYARDAMGLSPSSGDSEVVTGRYARQAAGLPPISTATYQGKGKGRARDDTDGTGVIPIGLDRSISKGKGPVRSDSLPSDEEGLQTFGLSAAKIEEQKRMLRQYEEGKQAQQEHEQRSSQARQSDNSSSSGLSDQVQLTSHQQERRALLRYLHNRTDDLIIINFRISVQGRGLDYAVEDTLSKARRWIPAIDLHGPKWTAKMKDFWNSSKAYMHRRKFLEKPYGDDVPEPAPFGRFILRMELWEHREPLFEIRDHETMQPGQDRSDFMVPATELGQDWNAIIRQFWADCVSASKMDKWKRWVDFVGIVSPKIDGEAAASLKDTVDVKR